METFKKVGKVIIPIAVLLLPMLVLAQFTPPDPGVVGGTGINLAEVRVILEKIAQFLIIVGVIIAVIMIIWGGILWITGGGGENTKKGQDTVKHGIIGAIIVLGVGVILQTIALLVSRDIFN